MSKNKKNKMERQNFIDLAIARQKYRNEDEEKPKYIFHGNHQLQEEIIPRKPPLAIVGKESDMQEAIYGSVKLNGAIPYSMKVEKEWVDEFSEEWLHYAVPPEYKYEVAQISAGYISPSSKGYVYVLDAEDFIYSNEYQWISKKETKPVDIVKLDYKEVKEDHFFFPHLEGFEKIKRQ